MIEAKQQQNMDQRIENHHYEQSMVESLNA